MQVAWANEAVDEEGTTGTRALLLATRAGAFLDHFASLETPRKPCGEHTRLLRPVRARLFCENTARGWPSG